MLPMAWPGSFCFWLPSAFALWPFPGHDTSPGVHRVVMTIGLAGVLVATACIVEDRRCFIERIDDSIRFREPFSAPVVVLREELAGVEVRTIRFGNAHLPTLVLQRTSDDDLVLRMSGYLAPASLRRALVDVVDNLGSGRVALAPHMRTAYLRGR